jgi:CheY-like chemotaxis protein
LFAPVSETARPRALVVDDQQDVAESFARILQAMGCEANFVTNPYMAVELAGKMKAQVVFLDLGMPGIDGYELARILRAKHGWDGLKIVAVTGHAADEDRTSSRKAGFDAHVVKPVDPKLIECILRTLFPVFSG